MCLDGALEISTKKLPVFGRRLSEGVVVVVVRGRGRGAFIVRHLEDALRAQVETVT